MINTIEQFGRNAGFVWNVLSKEGPLPIDRILDKTHLRLYEVEIAIGWLAREDKISYHQGHYSISSTNLTTSIGSNAGILWHVLDECGKSTIQDMLKQSHLPTQEIYKAIGWLAREEKLAINLG
ncbi:MAG TPA: winged helix-turn-helix domain-containing protein [Candidatus Thermoplasmatota archaeon]|nr:winged helix-turn-helix domain-containing protein [Candidatus Thermoplasmatota archaeon]